MDTEVTPAEVIPEVTQEEVSVETTAPETPETPEEGIVLPPPKKKTAQERIDEITAKRRQAERDAEYWKKKALEKEPVQEPVRDFVARPVLDNYETVTEYEDALFAWHENKKQAHSQAEQRKEKEKQIAIENENAVNEFNRRAEKLRSEYEDFDDITDGEDAAQKYSDTMRYVLLRSENGPEVAYFLGRPENSDRAAKIRSLTPEMQIYELGRIEQQILLAKKTTKQTGAPPPIKPLGATGGATLDESKLTDDEWYALERKRERERLEKRYKE